MSTSLTCCPNCGSRNGFAYSMIVKHEMIGMWGEPAEAGESTTTAKGRAACLDCKKYTSWQRAEGEQKPQRGTE